MGATQETMERTDTRLAQIAAVLNRAHADLVAVTAEAIATEAWGQAGIRSPEHWLILRAGLSPARARSIVALARRATELPATMAMAGEGRLSLEQAATIGRYAPADYEASVADLAQFLAVPQITRATAAYFFDATLPAATSAAGEATVVEPDRPTRRAPAPADEAAHDPARLSMTHDEDGRFRLTFNAPPDEGAIVDSALRQAKDALFTTEQRIVSMAEAFTHLMGASLDQVTPRSRRDRYRVLVHLHPAGTPARTVEATTVSLALSATGPASTSTEATPSTGLHGAATATSPSGTGRATVNATTVSVAVSAAGPRPSGPATAAQATPEPATHHPARERARWVARLTGGPPLPEHLTRKLTCDALTAFVHYDGAHPINLGRSRRILPERTRAIVLHRDGACRFPGCTARGHVDIHHVIHWADGGTTDTTNLIALCPYHHNEHHRGTYTITGNPDLPDTAIGALRFHARSGAPIGYAPPTSISTGTSTGADAGTSTGDRQHPYHGAPYQGPTGEKLHLRWVGYDARPAPPPAPPAPSPAPAA